MDRKVWAISSMIIGVLSIFGSLFVYYQALSSQELIGIISNSFPVLKDFVTDTIRNEKAYSFAGLGLGILLSMVGAMLFTDFQPKRLTAKNYIWLP